MHALFYLIYSAGALFALLFATYIEWWLALPLLFAIPYAAIYVAEYTGFIRFHEHKIEPSNSLIDKIVDEDLTDKEAAKKYGWSVVVEMDERLKRMEDIAYEAKKKRDKFAELVRGLE